LEGILDDLEELGTDMEAMAEDADSEDSSEEDEHQDFISQVPEEY